MCYIYQISSAILNRDTDPFLWGFQARSSTARATTSRDGGGGASALQKQPLNGLLCFFLCNRWDIHLWSLMHISSNIYTTIQIYLHSTLNMSVSFYIYMARCASYRAKQPIFSKGDLRFASWCWSELLPSSIDLQDHHIWYSFSSCVMILKVYEIHIWYVRIDPLFHPISILNIDTS